MADKAKNVVLNFKMDGQVQYAKTLKEINAVMNTAAKEYKNHIAAMGKDATATEKLSAEKKKLEVQMEAARKRTQMLSTQYEAMSKSSKTTTGQLAQMYGKLLDAQNAEVSLQKSMDRVNGGLSEQAQEAREAKDTLEILKNESQLLEAEQKKLTSSMKLQNAELGENASEAEKFLLAQKQLSSQMDLSKRTVANLEKQLESAKKVYGENSVEVLQMEVKINEARTTISKFNKSLDDLNNSSDSAGDGMSELSKKMDINNLLEATEILQGLSEKLLEVGKTAMDLGLQFGDSQTNIQANLGITADEAEKLNGVVDEVFKNGVVGSMEEASQAVMIVKQSFGDLNDADLEKLTNNITTIAKRTGTDVQENVNAANKMMMEFGLNGEQAMDLIADGYQNNLNKSQDFTDTLNEYAPLFADAGFSADQMLSILKTGMEGGALNTDKVADAVKELQIRFADGTFEDNLDMFSSGTADLFKKWQDGKVSMSDVMNSIQKDIQKMDPTEQQAALTVLGTQFEDLGIRGTTSLLGISDSMTDVTGKADEMAQKSPGEKWEASLRELQTTLIPIGQNLVDAFTPIIDGLIKMGEWFGKLPGPVQTFVTVFGGVTGVAVILAPAIIAVALAFGSLNIAMAPITAIILGIAAAIAGIVLVIKDWGSITEWIGKKYNQFISWLSSGVANLAKGFTTWFTNMKDAAINKFGEMAVGAVKKVLDLKNKGVQTIQSFKDGVVRKASELKTNFVNKVNEIKDGAVNKFNNLRDQAGQVMNAAKEKILSPIQAAKDKIGDIVDGIKGFFSGMKLEIPKIKMPKLPKFKIDGKFSLDPPSVPKLSIQWNAKGRLFTEPTIAGLNNGVLQGFGEAGPEVGLPLNDEVLGAIGKGIASTMGGNNRPLILQIDGRTFAQITGDYTDAVGGARIRRIERGLA